MNYALKTFVICYDKGRNFQHILMQSENFINMKNYSNLPLTATFDGFFFLGIVTNSINNLERK